MILLEDHNHYITIQCTQCFEICTCSKKKIISRNNLYYSNFECRKCKNSKKNINMEIKKEIIKNLNENNINKKDENILEKGFENTLTSRTVYGREIYKQLINKIVDVEMISKYYPNLDLAKLKKEGKKIGYKKMNTEQKVRIGIFCSITLVVIRVCGVMEQKRQ